MAFTWENHRRPDGSLDLVAALYERSREVHAAARLDTARFNQAVEFLDKVEELSLIRSRQAASIALAHAIVMAGI